MHIAAAPMVSLIFAAAFGLLNLWLSVRAARVRLSRQIMMGDGGVPEMQARMRAHANFNEYVPIALILMALIEMNVGQQRGLWIIGAILVVARVLHPFGMDRPAPNPYRMAGIALTILPLLALVIWAVLIAYGIRF